MAAGSEANRAQLSYVLESTFGVLPANPAMKRLRGTSYVVTPNKRVVTSREIREDRMRSGSAVVGRSNTGNSDFELSLGGDYDDFLEAVLCGTRGGNLNLNTVAAIAGNKFSKTGAFANAVVGQRVYASGFTNAANNGWHLITARTNDDITVADSLVVEGATAQTILRGRMIRNGVVRRSFAFEMAYLDIGAFFLASGARLGSLSLNITAEQAVTGTWNWMGTIVDDQGAAYANSYVQPTNTRFVTASENVGTLFVDDLPVSAAVRSLTLNVNNNMRNQPAVGEEYPTGIAYGGQDVTGRIEVYFTDRSLYRKAIDHSRVKLVAAMLDADGNAMHMTFPAAVLGEPQMPVTAQDTDVLQAFDFQAFPDTGNAYHMQLDLAHA